ncbi:MAG: tetratricopeptide repeat protein [Flavobacteriales bacterium]|nr:tetratricopeptide repeat protein [Flavobacteriales bacterium]
MFLTLVTVAVHSPVLFNGYNLDDELVTRNHRLTSKGISAIPEIYRSPYYEDEQGYSYGYRPTVLASFAIEHSLFGESPFMGHLINLLLYAITVVLIFSLVLKIFPDKWWLAFGTALLFTIHPIHTEVVASIKNRDEILSLLFGLAGCFALIHPKRFWLSLPIGIFFFYFALTSKMSAVMLVLLTPFSLSRRQSTTEYLLLHLAFSVILCFVLQQRESINYQRGNIVAFITVIAFIRLITDNHTQSKIIAVINKTSFKIYRLIQQLYQVLVTISTKSCESASKLSNTRLLEILIALAITIKMPQIQAEYFPEFVALVVISFLFLPTNIPDAFFRFSLILILYGNHFAFNNFLVVFAILMNLHYLLRPKSTILKYLILGLPVSIIVSEIYVGYPWFDYIGIVSFQLGLMFFVFIEDKVRNIQWYVLLLLAVFVAGSFGYWLSAMDGLRDAILISIPAFLNILVKHLNLDIYKTFSKQFNELKKRIPAVLLMAVLSITIFEVLRNHNTPSQVKVSLPHDSRKFNPSIVWSAEHIASWKRPFDYAEHPLSPFAPLSWKLGTAFTTLNAYLVKLMLPYPMAFYYGYDEVTISNLWQWKSIASVLIHLMLVIGIFLCWKNYKSVSIGLIMYLTSIALFSGMAEMVAGMFAERFAYVASFGFCLGIVGFVQLLLAKFPSAKTAMLTVAGVILISYSAYSFHRDTLWKDKITLMRHDIKNVPNSAQAHNLLAHALMEKVFDKSNENDQKQNDELILEARDHFDRATEIYPRFFNAWVDKGKVSEIMNQPEEAIDAFKRALEIDSTYTPLVNWIGKDYELLGQYENATKYFERYLSMYPNDPVNYDNLARVLFMQKRYKESIQVCESYLKMDPNNEGFKNNIQNMKRLIQESNQD